MSDNLLKTKLHIPAGRTRLVHRSRLIDQLMSGIDGRLSLISAPAGSGKTTLVCDFVRQINRPTAWISLDSGDDDVTRLLTYVVAALDSINVRTSNGLRSLLESSRQHPIETTATMLLNDISSLAAPAVLVLDDYHAIRSETVHNILTFLLNNLPPCLHIVITSRTRTPLSVSRLRARGQLTELHISDLRFTADEATEFLRQVMGLTLADETISALETRTEGWIAGLQLAALSLQRNSDEAEFLKTFSGRHNFVLDYLVDEVISQQPEHIQSFLLRTSILSRLTGPLCDTVTGQQNGQATLIALEQSNLFVVALDNKRQWYRYHHLFSEFLIARAQESLGESGLADLHRRASNWYRESALTDEAIRHSLAAQDFDTAAEMIEKSSGELYSRGALSALKSWLESLPDATRRARPRSSIYYAWTLLLTSDGTGTNDTAFSQAEDYLRSAENQIKESTDDSYGEDLGMIYAVRTSMSSWHPVRKSAFCAQKDLSNIIRCGQQSLSRLRPENLVWRCVVNIGLGLAYRYIGSIKDATASFAEASRQGSSGGNLAGTIFAHCNWAQLLIQQGQLHKAEHVYREGLRVAAARNGGLLPITGQLYIGLGRLFYEWNNLDEAARSIAEGIKRTEAGGSLEPDALLKLARIRILQRDAPAASELIEQVTDMTNSPDTKTTALTQARIEHAMLMLAENNIPEASKWAATFGPSLLVDPDPWIEHEYIALGRVMNTQGDQDKVIPALEILRKDAAASGRVGSQIEICTVLASSYQNSGDTDAARARLIEALERAEPSRYTRLFVDQGQAILTLLNEIHQTIKKNHSYASVSREYIERLLTTARGQFDPATNIRSATGSAANFALVEPLSDRELEILSLISTGHSNQEIADKSFVALSTVKWHINNIYGKLQVTSRTQAIVRSQQLGLV